MKRSNITLLFLFLIKETTLHSTCCHKKEVNGIKYEHIDDHNMSIPSECKNHCVYKQVKNPEKGYFCFGPGNFTAECLTPGCPIERDSVFVNSAGTDRVFSITTATNQLVYGPWSDERLSAFQFTVQIANTDNPGFVGLAFTPCYLCFPVYRTFFALEPNGGSTAFLDVNGIRRVNGFQFSYALSANNPVKILVQTFPLTGGFLRITAFYIPNDLDRISIIDYTTTQSDGLAPYGITYAIIGTTIAANNAATYEFNDVDRSPTWFPIADCREGRNRGLTAETKFSVKINKLIISEPLGVSKVDSSQRWCIVVRDGDCECDSPDNGCPRRAKQGRGHIQKNGEAGKVRNLETCKFLKAEDPKTSTPGELTLTCDTDDDATKFQFITAPNTEINQLRFGDEKFVIAWENMEQFDDDSADGTPVSKIAGGRDGANPLTSCFKVYNFLSNVDDK